jgi:hypothetical protein
LSYDQPNSEQSLTLSRDSEIMLSIFARRNNGLFILDGPKPLSAEGAAKALDVYCVFDQEALPYALLAARNAVSGMDGLDVRFHACRESDGALLNSICGRSRVFGERRRAAR